jgi:hypothetical protein
VGPGALTGPGVDQDRRSRRAHPCHGLISLFNRNDEPSKTTTDPTSELNVSCSLRGMRPSGAGELNSALTTAES